MRNTRFSGNGGGAYFGDTVTDALNAVQSSVTSKRRQRKRDLHIMLNPAARQLPALAMKAQEYLGTSLTAGTKQQYSSPVRRFLEFLKESELRLAFPIDEIILVLYATMRADTLGCATIRGEIAAIRSWCRLLGVPVKDPKPCATLRRVLAGVARTQKRGAPARREPITFPVLINLLDHCTGKGAKQQCIRSGMLLAYFGLLRPGEWTQRSSYKPDPIRTLTTCGFLPVIGKAYIHATYCSHVQNGSSGSRTLRYHCQI